jgi:trehalose 2-sulfotransferase
MNLSDRDASDWYLSDFDFAQVKFSGLSTNYVIATTPRSGSTHLSMCLYGHEGFGFPLEYLNLDRLAIKFNTTRTSNFDQYWNFILKTRTDDKTNIFGVKCFAKFAKMLRKEYRPIYRSHILQAKVIFLVRRNALGQAISYVRAYQTQRWFANRSESLAPRYDAAMIDRALKRISGQNRWWNEFLAKHQAGALRVYYEDFVTDPDLTIRKISNLLGVESPVRRNTQIPLLDIQRDDLNDDWARRFAMDLDSRDLLEIAP